MSKIIIEVDIYDDFSSVSIFEHKLLLKQFYTKEVKGKDSYISHIVDSIGMSLLNIDFRGLKLIDAQKHND